MIISVRVKPKSQKSLVVKSDAGLIVSVDAPAAEGKANRRLIEILADYFKVTKSQITIIRGLKSKNKVLEILTEKKLFKN